MTIGARVSFRRRPIEAPILEVEDLIKHYPARRGAFGGERRTVRAVDGVSFQIGAGEVLAVVGESGCGKSTLGRLAIRLLEPSSGRILLAGEDITHQDSRALRRARMTAQIVFQDPFSSLNPRMTVGAAIAYPLVVNRIHGRHERAALECRVGQLLEQVGLSAAHASRLPHELSGGQRQRVGIARAIAVRPRFVVLDEPVAALDLSAQARVLNLFKDLQRELGMAYLFITHDLSVAHYMADRILVMYAGQIVEIGDRAEIFRAPRHPYTRALLAAALLGEGGETLIIEGDPPSPIDRPSGCRFASRCPSAADLCHREAPALNDTRAPHPVACHLVAGRL